MTVDNNTSGPLVLYYTPRSTRPYWLCKQQVDGSEHVSGWMRNTPGMVPRCMSYLRRNGLRASCQQRYPIVHEYHTRYLSSFVKMTYPIWRALEDACFPHVCRSKRVSEHDDMEAWLCKNIQGNSNFLLMKSSVLYGSLEIRFHRPEDHMMWRMVWE